MTPSLRLNTALPIDEVRPLCQKPPSPTKEIERNAGGSLLFRKAFYPLTLPLTVGPGSIATAITLGANSPHSGGNSMALALIAAAAGALVLALSVFICYAFADRTAKLLGPTAMSVMMRLSAFLLTCIGLQIVWNGISSLIRTVIVSN